MNHLIIAPHPDDAVLSCGGLITTLVQAGERVTVFTVMAGPLPPDVVISPFIAEHLIRWELGPDPVPARRIEDQRAAAILGARVQFGPFPDALYRTDGQGSALYPDLERLFGDVHPDDPVLRAAEAITTPAGSADVLYVPLGAGHHVDHLLVRDILLRWLAHRRELAVFFYEEYPYSADGDDTIRVARAAIPLPLTPVVRPMGDAALTAKISAIACHRSQISTFWPDVDAMAAAVRDYARAVGAGAYAERLWQPVRRGSTRQST